MRYYGFIPPTCLKCQSVPLMAFYIGHINLRLSPPQGTALILLGPIHPPSVHDLQLVNELQEGSGRSARRSQVDESPCLWSCWKGQTPPGFQSLLGGNETLIMYLVGCRRLWPPGPVLGCNYILYYCLFTTIVRQYIGTIFVAQCLIQ